MTNLEKKMQKLTPAERKKLMDNIGEQMGANVRKPASKGKKTSKKK